MKEVLNHPLDLAGNNLLKILVYLQNNLIILFEVQKKYKSKNRKGVRTKNGRIMLLSKCEVCDSEKSKSKNLGDF